QDSFAVRSDIGNEGVVEPGEVFLRRVAGTAELDSKTETLVRHQYPARLRDVSDRADPGNTPDESDAARKSRGVTGAIEAALGGGKPDSAAFGSPGEPLRRRVDGRQRLLLASQVYHRQTSTVVRRHGMVHERDGVPLWRDSRMADPACRFVKNLTDR